MFNYTEVVENNKNLVKKLATYVDIIETENLQEN